MQLGWIYWKVLKFARAFNQCNEVYWGVLGKENRGLHNYLLDFDFCQWTTMKVYQNQTRKLGQRLNKFDCLFVCNRGDTYYSITTSSRQGNLAKPLSLLFLTPKLALSKRQKSVIKILYELYQTPNLNIPSIWILLRQKLKASKLSLFGTCPYSRLLFFKSSNYSCHFLSNFFRRWLFQE